MKSEQGPTNMISAPFLMLPVARSTGGVVFMFLVSAGEVGYEERNAIDPEFWSIKRSLRLAPVSWRTFVRRSRSLPPNE